MNHYCNSKLLADKSLHTNPWLQVNRNCGRRAAEKSRLLIAHQLLLCTQIAWFLQTAHTDTDTVDPLCACGTNTSQNKDIVFQFIKENRGFLILVTEEGNNFLPLETSLGLTGDSGVGEPVACRWCLHFTTSAWRGAEISKIIKSLYVVSGLDILSLAFLIHFRYYNPL